MKEVFRPTWAEIDLDNLTYNFKNIREFIKPETKLCAVIKANAYAHGSVALARLYEQLGVDFLAVATCEEALELRNHGITKPLMCLGYVPEDRFEQMIANQIDVTIYSLDKAKALAEIAKAHGKLARVHIKIDSGMSRLGLQADQAGIQEAKAIAMLEGIELIGLFSHFAMADEKDPAVTHDQFAKYKKVADAFEEAGIQIPIKHICNSAGIMMFPEYHMDMVRAGIILYGHYPSADVDQSVISLKPAMSLKTTVSHIKMLESGRGISYGHKYITQEDSCIATLPVGYADGFTRMLSGKASLKIGEEMAPVVGRICMDQCMIKVASDKVQQGDVVTIFSGESGVEIERFAEMLGTINYELLCMVQRRVPRVYLRDNEILQVVDYLTE